MIEKLPGLARRVEDPALALQGIREIKELGILYKQYGIAPKLWKF